MRSAVLRTGVVFLVLVANCSRGVPATGPLTEAEARRALTDLLDAPGEGVRARDLLERLLLSFAKESGWQLEAWAVFANHYHIVARGNPDSRNLGEFLHDLHGVSAREMNKLDGVSDRKVWFNFRDTKLTIQHSYLARLNYVHQNAVKHKLVAVANQYPWCSAAWFERVASPAQVKTIYGFKIDRVKVEDDF